jgi:DNA-binding PadR family transcriptional regulator
VSPVFGHGRLRLYLLKLLDESPRHGYEIIRLLEDRFLGLYAPSAGTVYPRLARLEAEGLVVSEELDGRKVYRLTDAGREELARREDELASLEAAIAGSVGDLAREVRDEVRMSVRSLRDELKAAAREVRRDDRHWAREEREWAREKRDSAREMKAAARADRHETRAAARSGAGGRRGGRRRARVELEVSVEHFRHNARDVIRATEHDVDDATVDEVHRALDEALARIREAMSSSPPREP